MRKLIRNGNYSLLSRHSASEDIFILSLLIVPIATGIDMKQICKTGAISFGLFLSLFPFTFSIQIENGKMLYYIFTFALYSVHIHLYLRYAVSFTLYSIHILLIYVM